MKSETYCPILEKDCPNQKMIERIKDNNPVYVCWNNKKHWVTYKDYKRKVKALREEIEQLRKELIQALYNKPKNNKIKGEKG